jgi:hypothetical protein
MYLHQIYQVCCFINSVTLNQSFGAHTFSLWRLSSDFCATTQCFSVSVPWSFKFSSVLTYSAIHHFDKRDKNSGAVFGPGLSFLLPVPLTVTSIFHIYFQCWYFICVPLPSSVRESTMYVAICLFFLKDIIYNKNLRRRKILHAKAYIRRVHEWDRYANINTHKNGDPDLKNQKRRHLKKFRWSEGRG